MTVVISERAQTAEPVAGDELLHLCRVHKCCGPEVTRCRSYCGVDLASGPDGVTYCQVTGTSRICVVCDEMFARELEL